MPRRRRPDRATRVIVAAAASAVVVLGVALQPSPGPTAAVADDAPAHDGSGAVATPTPTPASLPGAPTTAPSPAPDATFTIAFAGDVHGEAQIADALTAGEGLRTDVTDVLAAADLAVLNLETPVGTTGTAAAKAYAFQAPPELLPALAAAGVDVVSVANNHSLDRGVAGLRETLAGAEAAGIATVGGGTDAASAYAPHVVTLAGQRVAVLGLSRVLPRHDWAAGPDRPGLASGYDLARAVDAVRAARGVADHVVVIAHWGTERWPCPDETQVDLAAALHDAGAAAVIGAHPHLLQGVDRPRPDQVTAYSLGNFVWYAASRETGLTSVLTVTFDRTGVADVAVTAARIGPDGRPWPADDADTRRVDEVVRRRVPGRDCPAGGVPRR